VLGAAEADLAVVDRQHAPEPDHPAGAAQLGRGLQPDEVRPGALGTEERRERLGQRAGALDGADRVVGEGEDLVATVDDLTGHPPAARRAQRVPRVDEPLERQRGQELARREHGRQVRLPLDDLDLHALADQVGAVVERLTGELRGGDRDLDHVTGDGDRRAHDRHGGRDRPGGAPRPPVGVLELHLRHGVVEAAAFDVDLADGAAQVPERDLGVTEGLPDGEEVEPDPPEHQRETDEEHQQEHPRGRPRPSAGPQTARTPLTPTGPQVVTGRRFRRVRGLVDLPTPEVAHDTRPLRRLGAVGRFRSPGRAERGPRGSRDRG
jgi:hypothetical protein